MSEAEQPKNDATSGPARINEVIPNELQKEERHIVMQGEDFLEVGQDGNFYDAGKLDPIVKAEIKKVLINKTKARIVIEPRKTIYVEKAAD